MLAQDDRLTRRVGGITILALAGLVVFSVVLSGNVERGDFLRIRVYLHHASGLREGAPLAVAGRAVGKIESIARSPQGAKTPLGGDEGIVAIVRIERATAVRMTRGGDVFVASQGPLSDRYLEFGAAPPGPAYAEGDQVLGQDAPSLDRVLERTWDNLTIAKVFIDELRPDERALVAELDKLGDNLVAAIPDAAMALTLGRELKAMIAEARTLRDVGLGGSAGLARIDAVVERARTVIAQGRLALDVLAARARTLSASVDALRGRIDGKGAETLKSIELAIDRARAAFDKVEPLLAQIHAINDRLARGEGSLGRLMKDPEFPEDAKELGKILKRQPWKIFARPVK